MTAVLELMWESVLTHICLPLDRGLRLVKLDIAFFVGIVAPGVIYRGHTCLYHLFYLVRRLLRDVPTRRCVWLAFGEHVGAMKLGVWCTLGGREK